jgi:hypothetical protein
VIAASNATTCRRFIGFLSWGRGAVAGAPLGEQVKLAVASNSVPQVAAPAKSWAATAGLRKGVT